MLGVRREGVTGPPASRERPTFFVYTSEMVTLLDRPARERLG
jgi:hypothetical protein